MNNNNNFNNDFLDNNESSLYYHGGGEHQQNLNINSMDMSMTKTSQGAFASSMKMNSSLDMSQYAQLTRHARRIYVGGIPPNYADEEIIRNFLNSVIAKGMGEENDNSYVISIYANQKKCFAFVEVKSIELASACLDLDGIIFKKIVLKILRANEYKPDLVTPAMLGKPIRLDLSSFAFGSANIPSFQAPNSPNFQAPSSNLPQQQQHQQQSMSTMQQQHLQIQHPQYNNNNLSSASMSNHSASNHSLNSHNASMNNMSMNRMDMGMNPDFARSEGGLSEHHGPQSLRLDSIIQFSSLTGLDPGSIVIVGFPYEDPHRRGGSANGGLRGQGCHSAPKCMRSSIRKFRYGSVENPEYGVDLSTIKFVDVGDVLAGKSGEETRSNLATTVSELVLRGGIPYVVGGSGDQSFASVQGLMAVAGGNVGVLTISASLEHNIMLLEDARFCGFRGDTKKSPNTMASQAPTCEGRYVAFAAQGSQSSIESANFTTSRGGQIVWLSRDLRNSSLKSSAVAQFKTALKSLSVNALTGVTRPVAVCLDMGALCSSVSPYSTSSHSPVGLSMEEVLEMVTIAGMNSNVALFDVTEFSPEAEDSRGNMLLAELFYRFSMGVASRVMVASSAASGQQFHAANGQQTSPFHQQQQQHQNRDRSGSNLSAGGHSNQHTPHGQEMHLHNAGSSRASSNNSSTLSNPHEDITPFSPHQHHSPQYNQHQQLPHYLVAGPSGYISEGSDLHQRRPAPLLAAHSQASSHTGSSGSNSSMYSNFTADSSFTTTSGGSSRDMHTLQQQQQQQGKGSPGIPRTASGLSGYPPHQQQHQHQAIPTSPRRSNSLMTGQSTSNMGGVAMANFFTPSGGNQGEQRPPLLHEFSGRTPLSLSSQQHDLSRSMANMSVGDLHQFDEALDLNLNYGGGGGGGGSLYAPMYVAPQQNKHQQPPYQQNPLSRHQRMDKTNSLTLSEESESEGALLPGLSRDVQLLVSDSSDSNSEERGVDNKQEGSPATTWASIPPGL